MNNSKVKMEKEKQRKFPPKKYVSPYSSTSIMNRYNCQDLDFPALPSTSNTAQFNFNSANSNELTYSEKIKQPNFDKVNRDNEPNVKIKAKKNTKNTKNIKSETNSEFLDAKNVKIQQNSLFLNVKKQNSSYLDSKNIKIEQNASFLDAKNVKIERSSSFSNVKKQNSSFLDAKNVKIEQNSASFATKNIFKAEKPIIPKTRALVVNGEPFTGKRKANKKKKLNNVVQDGRVTMLNYEEHQNIIGENTISTYERYSHVTFNLKDDQEYPELSLAIRNKCKINDKITNNLIPLSSQLKEGFTDERDDENEKVENESSKNIRKYQTPVQLNIMEIIRKTNKQQQQQEPEEEEFKTSPPFTFNFRREKLNLTSSNTSHNILDSSAPARIRGKEREKPKKSKISSMKKVILNERLKRKEEFNEEKKTLSNEEQKETTISDEYDEETETTGKTELFAILEVETEIIKNSELFPIEVKAENNELFTIPEVKDNSETLHCIQLLLHNRKYREYCNQLLSEEIDAQMQIVLSNLVRFQDKAHLKDPLKAKIKKRMVSGLREVIKNAKMKKLKMVIIAPDVEKIHFKGGLNDALISIIKTCSENSIPVVFGLHRRKMGHILKKHVPLSCIGIFNYDGTEEEYKKLVILSDKAHRAYKILLDKMEFNLNPSMKEKLLKMNCSDINLEKIRKEFWAENCYPSIIEKYIFKNEVICEKQISIHSQEEIA